MEIRNGARTAAIVIATVVILALLSFVKVPFTIAAFGRLVPTQEWILERGNDGQLIASLHNNVRGTCESYQVSNPSGDSRVSFFLNETIATFGHIERGDTLGYVRFSDVMERLVELEGELDVAQAALEVGRTGDKVEAILEAERELELIETQSQLKEKVVARVARLHEQDLVSQEEYEIADGEAELLKLQAQVARARLDAIRAGEKPEQVELLEAQVQALEQELTSVRERIASAALVAPISGQLTRSLGADTLLVVSDADSCTALVPVKLRDFRYAESAGPVALRLGDLSGSIEGTLVHWDRNVRIVSGEQTVTALVRLGKCTPDPWSGMVVMCDIPCGSVTVWEYLRRFFTSAVG